MKQIRIPALDGEWKGDLDSRTNVKGKLGK